MKDNIRCFLFINDNCCSRDLWVFKRLIRLKTILLDAGCLAMRLLMIKYNCRWGLFFKRLNTIKNYQPSADGIESYAVPQCRS